MNKTDEMNRRRGAKRKQWTFSLGWQQTILELRCIDKANFLCLSLQRLEAQQPDVESAEGVWLEDAPDFRYCFRRVL